MKKILLSLILILAFVGIASAVDYSYPSPMSIGYNYFTDFTVTSYGTGLNGTVDDLTFIDFGTSSTSRLYNGINIIGGTGVPGTVDYIFADAAGNIGLISGFGNVNYQAYGAGVPSWSGSGSANNPMYKLTTWAADTSPKKFAVDSSGNVYSHNGMIIKKFIGPGYPEQTILDVSGYVNCVGSSSGCVKRVVGIQPDSAGLLHVLVGSQQTYYTTPSDTGNLVHLIINSGNTVIKTEILQSRSGSSLPGFTGGGLVLDIINPSQNFTYMFAANTGTFLYHNSSSGTVDVGGGALTITGTDISYKAYIIYLASRTANVIRTYATNYEGYGVSFGTGTNPDNIKGFFNWRNGYGDNIYVITPGAALAYSHVIDNTQTNYSNYNYYAGWGYDAVSEPANLRDITNLESLSSPAVFPTSSNEVAGLSIYGYLLSKNKVSGSWSKIANPVKLTISGALAGFDSITLDKSFYNLTGDSVKATFTYENGFPWIYGWQICSRADCNDVSFIVPLIPGQLTSSLITTGLKEGNYFAAMTKKLPFLQSSIVASQPFQIRPPIIGVSWDKRTYNLLPRTSISTCQDSTPSTSYFTTILGYAGLQKGFFSCPSVPADANANNSIMRGSLYAKYTGTFYLNNSLGNVWNGTLSNGSGSLIYVLTNSSPTETWTLQGINESGETFSANAQVNPEDLFAYSLTISPNPAYNLDTLYLTFTRPPYKLGDYVYLMDGGGQILTRFDSGATSGTYYIDPSKQYTYGTWTAAWARGSLAMGAGTGTVATVNVINRGRPITNASIVPGEPPAQPGDAATATQLITLLTSNIFWALIIIAGLMILIAFKTKDGFATGIIGIVSAGIFTFLGWFPAWIFFSIIIIAALFVAGSIVGKQVENSTK